MQELLIHDKCDHHGKEDTCQGADKADNGVLYQQETENGAACRADRFHDAYLAPALQDLPELDNVILENPSTDGPFGAKAIGEMANNAQPAAIAAAIHDAVGVWVTEYPATPERVLRAIRDPAEPRREGKRVVFDERISLRSVSSNHGAGFLDFE